MFVFTQSSSILQGSESIAWDRSARMGTFGLFFYGPYQHWWYGLLNQRWPFKSTSHFLTKVWSGLPSQDWHQRFPVTLVPCIYNLIFQELLGPNAGDFESAGSWTYCDYSRLHMESSVTTAGFRSPG